METVILALASCSITSSAFAFSGASVIIATLSNGPYVSSTDAMPYKREQYSSVITVTRGKKKW